MVMGKVALIRILQIKTPYESKCFKRVSLQGYFKTVQQFDLNIPEKPFSVVSRWLLKTDFPEENHISLEVHAPSLLILR